MSCVNLLIIALENCREIRSVEMKKFLGGLGVYKKNVDELG